MRVLAAVTHDLDPVYAHGRNHSRVLIVVAAPALARLLRTTLMRHNYSVEVAVPGRPAHTSYERFQPDLVVIDFDCPSQEVTDLVREIRSRSPVPIIVLSERPAEHDKVAAFELGADDYVIKPVALNELLARIRVALRHVRSADGSAGHVLRAGDLEISIDPEHRRVLRAGRIVHLSPTEYELLSFLASYPDKLLTYRMVIEGVWGSSQRMREHTLHVYIARLRRKIERDPSRPRHLISEARAGYRFATLADA